MGYKTIGKIVDVVLPCNEIKANDNLSVKGYKEKYGIDLTDVFELYGFEAKDFKVQVKGNKCLYLGNANQLGNRAPSNLNDAMFSICPVIDITIEASNDVSKFKILGSTTKTDNLMNLVIDFGTIPTSNNWDNAIVYTEEI